MASYVPTTEVRRHASTTANQRRSPFYTLIGGAQLLGEFELH